MMGIDVEFDSFDQDYHLTTWVKGSQKLSALPLGEGGGAKHSPPGQREQPDCPEGVPPLCGPGHLLTSDISRPNSSNESNSTWCEALSTR